MRKPPKRHNLYLCRLTARLRRTLRFWNRIFASDNAHSYARVLLSPTGTQYPAGSPLFLGFFVGFCEGAYLCVRNWAKFCQNAVRCGYSALPFNGEILMRLRRSWQVFAKARTRRTLHFWNHVIGDDNAHSFACVRLFPASTQYPAGSPLTDFQILGKTQKGAFSISIV